MVVGAKHGVTVGEVEKQHTAEVCDWGFYMPQHSAWDGRAQVTF